MKNFFYDIPGDFRNRIRHKKLQGVYRNCPFNNIEALYLIHGLFGKYSIKRFFFTFEEKSSSNPTRNMHVVIETHKTITGVQLDGCFNLTFKGKTFVGIYKSINISGFAAIYKLLPINSEWYASKVIHDLVEEHLGIRSGVESCYFPEEFIAPVENTYVRGTRFLLHYTNIPAKTKIRHLEKLMHSNLAKYNFTECTISPDYSKRKFNTHPFDIYLCFRVTKTWNVSYNSFLKRCTLHSAEKHVPVKFKLEEKKLPIHTKLFQQKKHLTQPELYGRLVTSFERKCIASTSDWNKKNHHNEKPEYFNN